MRLGMCFFTSWQHFVNVGPSHQDYLADHIIHGSVIAAGAFHLGVVMAVAQEHFEAEGFCVENLQFQRPLLVDEDKTLQVDLAPNPQSGNYSIRIVIMTIVIIILTPKSSSLSPSLYLFSPIQHHHHSLL